MMARRGHRDDRKSAILVNGDLAKVIEGEEPVEMHGKAFLWGDILMLPENP